jgi:hypothetical protein
VTNCTFSADLLQVSIMTISWFIHLSRGFLPHSVFQDLMDESEMDEKCGWKVLWMKKQTGSESGKKKQKLIRRKRESLLRDN